MVKGPQQIKVRLINRGKDPETTWAVDLGPAPGPPGVRKVRLSNVPFLHAKPTWGDVIVVAPGDGRLLTWDRNGVTYARIGTRILEDSGRWAMIVDYAPHPDATEPALALARACAEHDIVCENAYAPQGDEPGRAFLAVKRDLTDIAVMARLRAAALPCELIQIHPKPVQAPPKKRAAKKPATKKPAARKPTKKPARKPATRSTTRTRKR